MAKIRFQGREFEIPEQFTNREMMDIERLSGVSAGQMEKAFSEGSLSLIVALAKIAMEREGAHKLANELLDADLGALETVEEDDAANPSEGDLQTPPPLTAVPGEPSGLPSSATSSA